MNTSHHTIVAPATASGGAIAVIRVSGEEAIACCDRIFRGNKPLDLAAGGTLHYGRIMDAERTLDDVVVALFRAPHSYTGENSVEISCHGSHYITSEIISLLIRSGASMAQPGEFTVRAFLAGKLDLAQAEAVADLIASDSRASHAMASTQMRGGYSAALGLLRDELLQLAALLELELDFSEEEVEFADRTRLREMMCRIEQVITRLTDSFALGNAIKQGVAVAIVGEPNVGKSTLLNRLLGEERALVSEIAGTTRDTVEETLNIEGVVFRFIDTAGLHDTSDRLEQMGIDRTQAALRRAQIILHVADATRPLPPAVTVSEGQTYLLVINKSDCADAQLSAVATLGAILSDLEVSKPPKSSAVISEPAISKAVAFALNAPDTGTISAHGTGNTKASGDDISHDKISKGTPSNTGVPTSHAPNTGTPNHRISGPAIPSAIVRISARTGQGIDTLLTLLRSTLDTGSIYNGDPIISNSRHLDALQQALDALRRGLTALDQNLPSDLLSEEIRQVVHHLGTITGEITNDDILEQIFSRFCIGK